MARTVRDARLESRSARAVLKPRGKPYWRAIDEGLHLGYRKNKTAGKWAMRRYIGDQDYETDTIGTADDTLDADGDVILTFAQAQAKARMLFVERQRVAAGPPAQNTGPYTVNAALDDYVSWLEHNRKSARDTRWRADALIRPELGPLPCTKLTTQRLRQWRGIRWRRPLHVCGRKRGSSSGIYTNSRTTQTKQNGAGGPQRIAH